MQSISITYINKNDNSKSISKVKWYALPGYLLFFMMLFVPTTYQPIKAILLAFCLFIITIGILVDRGKLNLHTDVLLWMVFYVLLGVFFIFIGVLRGAPGALRVSTVYVLWPIVFTLLIAGATKISVLKGIMQTLVIATIAIGIYSLSYIAWAWGWLPDALYIPLDMGQAIGFYKGFTEYNLYNISSLIFLVPFMLAIVLTWPKNQKPFGISKIFIWVGLILGLLLVLLSGRRALILVSLLSPVIILILSRFLPRQHGNKSGRLLTILGLVFFLLVIVFSLNLIFEINLYAVKEMFIQGFNFELDINALPRAEQFVALMEGWKEYPLLGAGHGAGVDYIRSVSQPWAYELSYVALLYQTGMIGFLLYGICICWILWRGIKLIKIGGFLGNSMLLILTGTICFLIANFTNPYLGKFDYMWVLFLPLMFINYGLLNKH
jgi:hypothetical protein